MAETSARTKSRRSRWRAFAIATSRESRGRCRAVRGFGKGVVNATDYADVAVFALAFLRAARDGKRFLFRTAAAWPKVLGGIGDRPLLEGGGLGRSRKRERGTDRRRLARRQDDRPTEPASPRGFDLFSGIRTCVPCWSRRRLKPSGRACCARRKRSCARGGPWRSTPSRERLDARTGNAEDDLRLSVRISNAGDGICAGSDRAASLPARQGRHYVERNRRRRDCASGRRAF